MKSDCVEEITNTLISKYKERAGIQAESYFVKVSDGARVMML
jgi:galactokinase